jgi:hypothetical protein
VTIVHAPRRRELSPEQAHSNFSPEDRSFGLKRALPAHPRMRNVQGVKSPEHLERPAPGTMDAIEEQLFAAAVERYAHDEQAMDRMLDDMESLSDQVRQSRSRPLLLRSAASLQRTEDLLLDAVLQTHPNAERALDRLMEEVAPDSNSVEEHARAQFDMHVDNDFDGMG